MERGPAVAVGRLSPGGPWVGFAADEGGYCLIFGESEHEVRVAPAETRLADLLSVALVHFADGEPAPDELQATHGDVADLVRWMADAADDGPVRSRLLEAVDAIDDGLAADAVMRFLEDAAALTAGVTTGEQADAIDLLAERHAEVTR